MSLSLSSLLLVYSLIWPAYRQDKWDLAVSQVKQLPPTAFPELPKQIVHYLRQSRCTIPQLWDKPKPHNVIRGRFSKNTQCDWAVLCSRNGVSTILVFWNGSVKKPSQIAKTADKAYLQTVDGGGEIGFSRVISTVGRKYIVDHYKEYGGRKPPPIDHEGIDDGYSEKGSMVFYFYRRRWLQLSGAD